MPLWRLLFEIIHHECSNENFDKIPKSIDFLGGFLITVLGI